MRKKQLAIRIDARILLLRNCSEMQTFRGEKEKKETSQNVSHSRKAMSKQGGGS